MMKHKLHVLFLILCLVLAGCGKDKDKEVVELPSNVIETEDESNEDAEEQAETDTETTEVGEGDVVVSNEQPVVEEGKTYTGLPALEQIEYVVKDAKNTQGLSTEKFSHSYGVAADGKPHQISIDTQAQFDEINHNALTLDNFSTEKVLYLTFDCGYEYENLTGDILDTLKAKNVPAAFFCTLDYLKDAPEFVTRMVNEGHIVGNHSTTHPSDSSTLSREELAWELLGVHNYLRVNFGYNSQHFRFPTGTYSENALELVDSVGYHSIFWSNAHADWDPENQPGVQKSFDTITSRLHPGSVILLHACSPDNAAILGDFINFAESQGYVFKSLDEYPNWT